MKSKFLLFPNLILLLLLNFGCSKELPELPTNELVEDPNFRPVIINSIERLNIDRVKIIYQIDYDYTQNPNLTGIWIQKNGNLLNTTLSLENTSFTSTVNMNSTYCFSLALTDGTWYSNWSYEICIDT